ncbi:MAG: hypothetical protein ACREMQ_05145, partial [Longimicrobiales bacterium]
MLKPSFDDFVRHARAGVTVPVSRDFLFDSDTAVTAYAKLTGRAGAAHAAGEAGSHPRFGFLLESLVGGEKWARYTFLGTAPRAAWKLERGGRISTWSPESGWTPPYECADPLADLDTRIRAADPVTLPG